MKLHLLHRKQFHNIVICCNSRTYMCSTNIRCGAPTSGVEHQHCTRCNKSQQHSGTCNISSASSRCTTRGCISQGLRPCQCGPHLQSRAAKDQDGRAKLLTGLQLCQVTGTMHMHLKGKRPCKSLGLPIDATLALDEASHDV